MTEPIVIQFNCPKCRDADWGRGVEWVTVDRDLLARMAPLMVDLVLEGGYDADAFTEDEWDLIKTWRKPNDVLVDRDLLARMAWELVHEGVSEFADDEYLQIKAWAK